MAFAPLLVGAILAVPVLALFDKLTYQKAREYAIASGATVLPERRLYPAMLSVILFPISLFVCLSCFINFTSYQRIFLTCLVASMDRKTRHPLDCSDPLGRALRTGISIEHGKS